MTRRADRCGGATRSAALNVAQPRVGTLANRAVVRIERRLHEQDRDEEVGVISKEVKVIGTLTELYIIASNYHVLPVIGFVDQKPQFIPDQTEVVKILEANLTDLTSQSLKSKEMTVGNNITIESPYYNIHGHVVWGATAMILSELVDIVRPIQ